MMLVDVAEPATLYTLIANTSGPLGNVPRPPMAVEVNSFNASKLNSAVSPGLAIKENTCSPGSAY